LNVTGSPQKPGDSARTLLVVKIGNRRDVRRLQKGSSRLLERLETAKSSHSVMRVTPGPIAFLDIAAFALAQFKVRRDGLFR